VLFVQVFVQEHKLVLPVASYCHIRPNNTNQPLFSNSTKLNCSNAAVTLLSAHKANPVALSTFWFNFRHARISSACSLLHATASATTQKNTLHVSLWCWCAYKILRNRSLFPEWGGICRSHISRRVLDFSEVLIQLLNHQIIGLPLFSPRTRS